MSSENPRQMDKVILKDAAIFFGWIAGILLIAGICWVVTQPVRNRFLVRAVNRVLEQSGESRRLGEFPSPVRSGSFMGAWYAMVPARQMSVSDDDADDADDADKTPDSGSQIADGTRAFIFSFIAEGTFFPCAAVVSAHGKVEEFIPLSSHGERILSGISPGILKLYARRIERIRP